MTDLAELDRVWYFAYGSNLNAARFRCYLHGGRPDGAHRAYPGCRIKADPQASTPHQVHGAVYFAGRSTTWHGGTACYDPDADGDVFGRAYLLTGSQVSDVLAQEMCRPPGADYDLTAVRQNRRVTVGPGRYETVTYLGDIDGAPMVALAPPAGSDHKLNAPTQSYLATMAAGLYETYRWPASRIAAYLCSLRGVTPTWDSARIETWCRELLPVRALSGGGATQRAVEDHPQG